MGIMDILKRHLPFSGQELKKIAIKFEKIYTVATSQSDYLRRLSLKMLKMESESQNTMTNSLQTNSGGSSKKTPDAVMDNNNWRPAQAGQDPMTDTEDWRNPLQNESRQRIVNKIMDTLKRHIPLSGQEGIQELKKIAIRLEEKIYTAATSQSDYLRKISLKMLTMESKPQNTMTNSLPTNSGGSSKNPTDAGPLGMQPQIGNPISIPMVANQGQARQQLLAQNMQNNITATGLQGSSSLTSTGLQGSSSLTSTMPGGRVLPSTSMPNIGQNANLQNIQGIFGDSQNSVANSMG